MILPVLPLPTVAAAPPVAIPAKALIQEKAVAGTAPESQAPTETAAPPSAATAGKIPPPAPARSTFNQLMDEMVADSAAQENPPATPAVSQLKATAKANPAPVPVDTLPELPPLPVMPRAKLPDTRTLSATPARAGTQDTKTSRPSNTNNAQAPSLPVEISVPQVIPPKPPMQPAANGSGDEPKVTAAAVEESPEPVRLEPQPVLEVKIHLDQPETLAAPESVVPAPAEPTPAFQKPAVQTSAVQAPAVKPTPIPPPSTQPVLVSTPSEPAPAKVMMPAPQVATIATRHVESAPVESRVTFHTAEEEQVPVRPASGSSQIASAKPQDNAETPAKQQNSNREQSEPAPAVQQSVARTTNPAPNTQPDAADPATPRVTTLNEEAPATPHTAPVIAEPTSTPVQTSAAPPSAPAVMTVPAAPVTTNPAKPAPAPVSAPLQSEPAVDPPRTQPPLRSMALEFTPDGASDIKVRLSERGGDVHISLHGTDPALAGRVREGVSDLVGSLAKAGYDAEAWTPSQGRQSEGRQQEQRQSTTRQRGDADAEEFSGMLQQPQQENS